MKLARVALYLFGIVMLIAMLETLVALLACSWVIVIQQRTADAGCGNFANNIRELITELIAGLLALIIAAKNGKE